MNPRDSKKVATSRTTERLGVLALNATRGTRSFGRFAIMRCSVGQGRPVQSGGVSALLPRRAGAFSFSRWSKKAL